MFNNELDGGQVVCHDATNDILMVPKSHEVNNDNISTISDIEIIVDDKEKVNNSVIVISSDDEEETCPPTTSNKKVSSSKITVAYSLGANKYVGTVTVDRS